MTPLLRLGAVALLILPPTAAASPASASPPAFAASALPTPLPGAASAAPAKPLAIAPAKPLVTTPAKPLVDVADVRELNRRRFAVDGLAFGRKARPRAAAPTPAVGTVREWVALDDVAGKLYRKDYKLRAVGAHIEVWVAEDLAFPEGDCRPAASTRVTDAQVDGLVREFDATIYPRETAAFSTPPDRDGTDPQLSGDFTGAGGRTVTLVDNVRDDNYFDFPATPTYIAGFFSAQVNALVDRNVMTIDGYDWLHRTGADPAHEPTDDLCTSRPARPRMYEGTFAHEWQHLLQSAIDPDEETWVDEGLADYAQTLVGYVDGTATVHHPGTDSHLACFQGFGIVRTTHNPNPRDCGGPQNSLNLWEEGAPGEVLADYGHAYQFMLYLRDRFGAGALSRLHRDGARQGLAGVAAALGEGTELYGVLHDFQTMSLVDKTVGDAADGVMVGVPRERVVAPSLRATVNLANPDAYARPGAAPNGADYVRLRNADGGSLAGADLTSVRFAGARTLPPEPLRWKVRDGALFSGNDADTDAAAVAAVFVPKADPTLRLRAEYGAEKDYDFGYVTVSTDGGRTYTPVAGDRTVKGPLGPGITGRTDGFEPHSYDLSGYAGRRILLGFRYVSDSAINDGGWLIDDVTVGRRKVSDGSTLSRLRSPSQIVPVGVHAWNVRLVGLDEPGRRARQVPVDQFAALRDYAKVVAIVAYDEPTGLIEQYAPYMLTVNGVNQPGGSTP